jgi:hypothetical protein
MGKGYSIETKQIETFREHFKMYREQYILIGGSAAKLLLDDAGFGARATRDLDIVLCVEALSKEFVIHFWDFIRTGGYEVWRKANGEKRYYRFIEPKTSNYPFMIEILANQVNFFEDIDQVTMPLVIDDEMLSLSAIILNREYYKFLVTNKKEMNGIIIADEHVIVPLKARAYLDLTERRINGEAINSDDIKKHRNDIYRLTALLTNEPLVGVPPMIKKDITDFLKSVDDKSNVLRQINAGIQDMMIVKSILKTVYCS